ncbi:MAG: DNA-processing protein DprA [Alphaproteobacteria bacterium]|nr:DNA-processing protein DprA [Alphaproteobacteria bacterium]
MTVSERSDSGITLTDDQRLSWLRLARSENVGPITFHSLIDRFGSAQSALEALPDLSRRGGAGRTIRISEANDAERELARARQLGCSMVASCETRYPGALRWADGAPPILAVRGQVSALEKPSVSIVGSRNASISGRKITHGLASALGAAGYSITSGLARGIDAAAHEAALDTGTIAVLAGGLDRPYPPQNIELLERICDSGAGAAVSEMPFGWEPRARDFPRRNRIVAGLGLGLVVVEAARKSGSLISARLAGELGRLVFSVPGSPLDPRAKGTNDLIKDGAILTTEADDILQSLAPLTNGPQGELNFAEPERDHDPQAMATSSASQNDRDRIADALGPTPVEIDEIMRYTDLPPSEVYLILLELDLAGKLERHPGGMVSKPPAA